jgi:MFS family permease
MKLTVLRHSLKGARATWLWIGATAGTVLALGMIFLGTRHSVHESTVGDLLAIAFGLGTLGWLLGPVWTGGSALSPAHFRLVPVPRRRLAIELVGEAFVGVGAAVTLLAFTSLIAYAARHGALPIVLAIFALVLELTFVVLLSRAAAGVLSRLTTSRRGGAIAGLTTAVLLVVSQSGWVLIERTAIVLEAGMPSGVSSVVRALPSGWGVVAVDAAGRSDWLLATGALVGLAVLIGVLLGAWSRAVALPAPARATVRGSKDAGLERRGGGRTRAALVRELRAWSRDPARIDVIVMAPAFALTTCLIPLIYDAPAGVPWAGPITAVAAATGAANLYGQDGTALWLTLLRPAAERHDVRGRQLAWLALFGPMTLVITVLVTVLSGQSWAWPWVLAADAAILGGGVGLAAYVSVTQLAPGPDPHRRASVLDRADTTGQSMLMFFGVLLIAAPALAVVFAGERSNQELVRWTGVAAGLGIGVLLAWTLGRLAERKLEARGPELLHMMRSGKIQETTSVPSAYDAMSGTEKALFQTYLIVGSLALFPQGLVPLIMKVTGEVERVWFLALYLREPWQWPTIALMIALGLACYGLAFRLLRRHRIA